MFNLCGMTNTFALFSWLRWKFEKEILFDRPCQGAASAFNVSEGEEQKLSAWVIPLATSAVWRHWILSSSDAAMSLSFFAADRILISTMLFLSISKS